MEKKILLFAVFIGLFAIVGFERGPFASGSPEITRVKESAPFGPDLFPNPCDPSGNSDVTVSGTFDISAIVLQFPDGGELEHFVATVRASGTDLNGNTYNLDEKDVDQILFNVSPDSVLEGFIFQVRLISPTGPSFIANVRLADLKNNTVTIANTNCIGN